MTLEEERPAEEAIPEPQPAESPEPSEDDGLPDNLKGKSKTDLYNMIRERDETVGKHSQELGELRKTASQQANYLSYIKGLMGGQPQQAQVREEQKDFDWTNPDEIKALVNKEYDEREKQRQLAEQQRYQQHVQANFYAGQRDAITNNPEIFEGIENDVSNAIWNIAGKQGGISADALKNPQTWIEAATHLRVMRKEYDKVIPQKKKPVAATSTEHPDSSRAYTGEGGGDGLPGADGLTHELLKHLPEGVDKKEFLKQVAAERKG